MKLNLEISVKSKTINNIYHCIGKHPFVCTFIICLLLTPFTFGAECNIPGISIFLVAVVLFAGICLLTKSLYDKGVLTKPLSAVFIICLTYLDYYLITSFASQDRKGMWILIVGILILIALKAFMRVEKKLEEKFFAFFIIGSSLMLKFFYVLTSSCYTRQNDVHAFGGDSGHAAYMEYLLFNKQLPDFDVRTIWQFYHPPFHHTICAAWINFLENGCGIDHNLARESLQMLTLFYSTACVIIVYKILRHFKLNGKALLIPLAVFSFHPSFILLSGSINNDILSIVFILASILNTLKWYDNPNVKNILKIALTVGFGMMTKLSAALVAPPIAFVFLVALIKNRKQFAKFTCQYAAFGIVCVPLGLWWGIRNYLAYKVPITFVPGLAENSFQYVGDIPFKERLTDFSAKQFSSVFEQWTSFGSYSEYNPTIAILKNSLFGESINEDYFPKGMLIIPQIFFWIGVFVAVASVILMMIYMFKKSNMKWEFRAFFMLFYGILMGNFYVFCYQYPHTCTQNFRYVAPLVAVGSLFIGIMQKDSQDNSKNKALSVTTSIVCTASIAFVVLSFITYFMVGTSILYE